MKLSTNFSLEELTATSTGLRNDPSAGHLQNLVFLVDHVLQPLRDLYGEPIRVNSGFRSAAVNRAVGGSSASQHCKGEAADLDCRDKAKIFRIIRDQLPFDQLIWEAGNDMAPDWVHVSFKSSGNRRQVLRMKNGSYQMM